MKYSLRLIVLISILLLTLISVGIYAVFRHQHLQAQKPSKTYTVAYNHPLTFTGNQQAQYTQTLIYHSEYGKIHDWFIQSDKAVKKNAPVLEYYNFKAEQKLTALRKQLVALDKKPDQLPLRTFLEQQFYLTQTALRIQENSIFEGKLHIIEPYPSLNNEVFAEIYSNKRIIQCTIDEKIRHQLKNNQEVEIQPHSGSSFKGRIIKIDTFPTTSTFNSDAPAKYKVAISTDASYPIGTHFKFSVSTHLISLPKDVLYDKNSVIIKKDKKMVKRIIKYREKSGMVIISEGLLPGEKVIAQSKNFTFN